jgi:negative modulator of initiation of replication
MQRTIEIEDDIYEFLRQHGDFGETPSVVLRRCLSLPSEAAQMIRCPTCGMMTESGKTFLIGGKTVQLLSCGHILQNEARSTGSAGDEAQKSGLAGQESPLMCFVADPVFVCLNATDKYLRILGFVAEEAGEKFDGVLKVSGRSRKYIGSREEIESSGKSTHPRPIPNSKYWAMTNSETNQKRKILGKILRALGYSGGEIQVAIKAIF